MACYYWESYGLIGEYMKQSRTTPYPLRLEDDLTQWVKEQAKAGDRSINAQINRLIREAKERKGGK